MYCPDTTIAKTNYLRNLRKCDWFCVKLANIDNELDIPSANIIFSLKPSTKYVRNNRANKPKKWFYNELKVMKYLIYTELSLQFINQLFF